jgi:hypothetical protein
MVSTQKWSKLNMFALLVLQQKAYMHCFQGSNQRWICYLVYKWVTHKSQYNLLMSNCATLSKSTMKFCFKPTDSVSKKTSHILAWLNSPPAYLSFWEFVLYSPILSFVFSFLCVAPPPPKHAHTHTFGQLPIGNFLTQCTVAGKPETRVTMNPSIY